MKKFFILLCLTGCCGDISQLPGHDFLGAQYVESPLGEEILPDTDPLIRFDAFDCTTFVETVVAGGNQEKLNQIRYKNGEIGFLTRNHFIESDWLENNKKYVQNVSSRFAPTKIRQVKINKQAWLKKVHGINVKIEPVLIDLEYIPYQFVSDIEITYPMIVLFVTDNPDFIDKIGTDLAVVHMGFVLPNGVLRHASSEKGAVVDVSWTEYINLCKQNKNNIGIALVDMK